MVFYFKARPEAGDYTIFMGLDKFENEELIKYGFPEDIWNSSRFWNFAGPKFLQPIARVSATKIREINFVIGSIRLSTSQELFPLKFLLPDLDRSPSFKAAISSSFQLPPISRLLQPIEWQLDRVDCCSRYFGFAP
uniref:Uncharacterized protein n=1 Tax=Tanacetum cinerariifolium TaxID=118510 RepID=A0A6L2KCL4_TANCI|nr:hypothetical protein [Tanacetum cinerariifolium]